MKYVAWVMMLIGVTLICAGASFTDEAISWDWRLAMMVAGPVIVIIGYWLEGKADPEDVPPASMP